MMDGPLNVKHTNFFHLVLSYNTVWHGTSFMLLKKLLQYKMEYKVKYSFK